MLLLALLSCLGHHFVVENPGSTTLGFYPRFQFLFRVLKLANVPALILLQLYSGIHAQELVDLSAIVSAHI